MVEPLLRVRGLVRDFDQLRALKGVDLDLDEGGLLILLGQNGAGKTTALRCVAGLLRATGGSVRVRGLDPAAPGERVRSELGLASEAPGLYERMNVVAYLTYFGRIYGMEEAVLAARIDSLLERFELAAQRDAWLGTFSKGMKQKVALIRATLHRPRLLLCDEPTSAMDASSSLAAWDYLNELRAAGAGVVVCSHHLAEAARVGGELAVMRRGEVVGRGTLDELRRRTGLTTKYRLVATPTLEEIYLRILDREA